MSTSGPRLALDRCPPDARPQAAKILLRWFRRNARPLPWRGNRDPYRIWISEVMLQQTQVATVIPYFERFLRRFPNLQTLADADEQTVLRMWEGLGYYRRARLMCRAAQQLAAAGHTTIPDDPDLVRSLPGFGRYTANAVLSQAYDRRLPILEANSQRLLCRLFAIDGDPRAAEINQRLWRHAEELLPKKGSGDFNQALMELGAMVCTPTKPNCEACPLRDLCHARRHARQHEIPRRARLAKTEAIEEVAVVVRRQDRVLIVQRPDEGRWARLWEFPHHPVEWLEAHESAARRLLASLGLRGDMRGEIVTIRHNVTRFNITMTAVAVEYRAGRLSNSSYPDSAWVRVDDLSSFPLSTPQRRLVDELSSFWKKTYT